MCSTCFAEIPATISVEPYGVIIRKECHVHGKQEAMLERDPVFYTYCSTLPVGKRISGHLVEVAQRCQLRCERCFYPLKKHDPEGRYSVEEIVNECAVNRHHAPVFILTGGEPTLHPEIGRVITECLKVGPVELLTNGVKLADKEFYSEIMPLVTDTNGLAHVNLSIHLKETDKWRDFIELVRADKLHIASALIVIDDHQSFITAVNLCRSLKDVVGYFHIKAAAKVWAEKSDPERIFVSDMLHWLEGMGDTVYIHEQHSRPHRFNVGFEKMHLQLISWQDVNNLDLDNSGVERTVRAMNGEVMPFMNGFAVNEGMAAGWLAGRRIEFSDTNHASPPVSLARSPEPSEVYAAARDRLIDNPAHPIIGAPPEINCRNENHRVPVAG